MAESDPSGDPRVTSAAASSPSLVPELVLLRSRTGAALIAATVLASASGTLDASASQVAIPAIGRSLHAGVAGLQWTLTGYLLAVAALLLLSGALADRFGRRRLVTVGLCTMLVAAAGCALAPSIGVLIVARVVEGIGGAMVVPSSLAMLNGTLQPADRARGIGIWAGLETLATSVGPYVAGWLVDQSSWRVVYLLSAPLVVICLVVLRRVPDITSERRGQPIDVAGGVLAVLGLGALVYALTAGPGDGWLAARVIVTAVVGVGALIALVVVEAHRRAPMLRLSLFTSRQFDAINVGTFVLYGALAAAAYLVFLQCELRLGYSAAKAGAALIPETVMFLLLAPVSGALVSRIGPRWLMVVGILLVAAGFGWLSASHSGEPYATAILPGVLLWGVGIGVAVTPLTAAVLAAVHDADLGEASAINDASARVGGLLVIALVPALIGATGGRTLAGALSGGFEPAMLVMAGLCVVAALISAVFVSDARRHVAPRMAPRAPDHGCALPVTEALAT
jgi:EmrB/QacA subfamily drug resistance transporter